LPPRLPAGAAAWVASFGISSLGISNLGIASLGAARLGLFGLMQTDDGRNRLVNRFMRCWLDGHADNTHLRTVSQKDIKGRLT
jgi:hypothetical protein